MDASLPYKWRVWPARKAAISEPPEETPVDELHSEAGVGEHWLDASSSQRALLEGVHSISDSPPLHSAHEYIYTPLKRDEIRILLLQPGTYDQHLQATLEIFKVDQAPEYAAISYCWGKFVFPRSIYIGGNGTLRITESLFGALRRFRSTSIVTALWADAICINQDDVAEESHQVAQITRVFRFAASLFVWLGEAVPTDKDAFRLLRKHDLPPISANVRLSNHDAVHVSSRQRSFFRDCETDRRVSDYSYNRGDHCRGHSFKSLDGLHTLLNRPYFRRLWPLPELLSHDKAHVCAGPHHAFLNIAYIFSAIRDDVDSDSPEFEDTLSWLIELGVIRASRVTEYRRKADRVKALIQKSNIGISAMNWKVNVDLLLDVSSLQASDSRDYLYCVLGCEFEGMDQLGYTLPGQLNKGIDYSIPAKRLWSSLSFDILNRVESRFGTIIRTQKGPATFLTIAGMQRARESGRHPSWTVDFSRLTDEMRQKARESDKNLKWFHYIDALHREFQCYQCSEASLTISAHGQVLGEVSHILDHSIEPTGRADFASEVGKILPWYLRCYLYVVESDRQSVEDRCSSARSLPIDHNAAHRLVRNYHMSLEEDMKAGSLRYNAVVDRLQARNVLSFGESQFAKETQTFENINWIIQQRRYHSRRNSWHSKASLARTTFGTAGWVPPLTTAGDKICLLSGSNVPLIIRKSGPERYVLVGDAHIDRMTDEIERAAERYSRKQKRHPEDLKGDNESWETVSLYSHDVPSEGSSLVDMDGNIDLSQTLTETTELLGQLPGELELLKFE